MVVTRYLSCLEFVTYDIEASTFAYYFYMNLISASVRTRVRGRASMRTLQVHTRDTHNAAHRRSCGCCGFRCAAALRRLRVHSRAHRARVPYESGIAAITRPPLFHYRCSRDGNREISAARLRVKGIFSSGRFRARADAEEDVKIVRTCDD